MKKLRFIVPSVALILLLVGITAGVSAQTETAYTTSFTTAITYQNIGSAPTNGIALTFHSDPTDVTGITIFPADLAAGASASLFIGNVSEVNSGFQGTAVMSSDQPLVATLVQVPRNSTLVKNRPLSNGLNSGEETALLATFLKNTFNTNTIMSIQNSDSEKNTVTIDFYNTSAVKVHTITQDIEAGAGYFVDAGKVAGLGTSFNGSVVATAKRADSSNGSIIASAMELSTNGTNASAFEGVSTGANKFFMPSALCSFGANNTNTAYAVQNTDLSNTATVTVTYSNGYKEIKSIGAGSKGSFLGCNATSDGTATGQKMPTGFLGAATITSDFPIIAIGKVGGGGLSTAFVGVGSGDSTLALPYVRWAKDADFNTKQWQRTNIAIQNVGDSTITGDINIKYINPNGSTAGIHTITTDLDSGDKANSNATNAGLTEFGINGGAFGGGAIIEAPAGSKLAVIARVATKFSTSVTYAEDYNGIPILP